MPSIDDWRRDWSDEDHVQRQHFAKSSLQRNFRGDVQRRVTSSSVSSTLAVVDCCWARGHRTGGGASPAVSSALSPYLFCAISGGVVCILNTFNFLKTYLFEGDSVQRGRRDDRGEKKDVLGRNDVQHDQLAAIDCFPLLRRVRKETAAAAAVRSGTRNISQEIDESVPLLCAVVEGWLCTFIADPDSPSHARSISVKTGNLHRAVKLPPDDVLQGKWTWSNVRIRFSPRGSYIVAVVTSRAPCGRLTTTANTLLNGGEGFHHAAFFCILKRQDTEANDAYSVEKSWTRVLASSEDPAVELLHVAWWDENDSVLLTVWSDGTVSLMNLSLEVTTHTSAFCSRAERTPGRITAAAAVPPVYHGAVAGRGGLSSSSCQPPSTTPHQAGLVALVVDGTIVVVFTLRELSQPRGTARGKDGGDEPPLKSAKMEATAENRRQGTVLRLQPGHQTYCSEDITIRDIALFENFLPYTLAVLLDSGAMLTLDTVTMEVLYHRPLKRLFPEMEVRSRNQQSEKSLEGSKNHDGDNALCTTSTSSSSSSYFIRPREKPMAMCVVEHNTAVVLRPP